jgi:predicted TIM-barrel fold metal-dependent hydrolase
VSIIDWHSHLWLPEHLGDTFGPQIDGHYGHTPSKLGTPEAHRAAMDADSVAQSVVIALVSDHLGMCVPNEFVADYVRDDPRLVGIASVDPNRPDCRDEFIYAITELGLSGLKLAPPYQAFHPHSESAMSLYDAAQELGVVVYFHQGSVSISQGVLDNAQPVLLDRVAREFPRLRIVVAHVGQPWFMETIALLRKHPNVYADVSARCTRPWQLKGILAAAMDYGVQGRLLFGSDFPTFRPAEHARSLRAVNDDAPGGMEIPSDVLWGIIYDRPLSLLGLDPQARCG